MIGSGKLAAKLALMQRAGTASIIALAISSVAAAAEAQQHIVFVYSAPVAGEEAAYSKDQVERVIPSAMQLAGFESAQRFEIKKMDATPSVPGSYLTVYDVDTPNISASLDALAGLVKSPTILSSTTAAYADIGPHLDAPKDVPGSSPVPPVVVGKPEVSRYYLFAHLSAGEGAETEAKFNEFYNGTHLPDVMRNPGFLRGDRGKLAKVLPASKSAPGYVAYYEFQTYDLSASIGEVDRRLRDGITRPFPPGAIGRVGGMLVYYAKPIGAKVLARN
jgi:hypothetical protein